VLAGFVIVCICMTELGRELAEARVRAGLSVEELSHRTKLSVPTLLAIERNQMNTLPGGLYARSMLRAYAREVGCDPEEIVRRFRAETSEKVDPLEMLDRMAAAANGAHVVERLHSADIDAADHRRAVRNTVLFAIVLLFGGAFYVTGGHIGHIESIKRLTHRSAAQVPAAPVPANPAEHATPPPPPAVAPKPLGTASDQSTQPTDQESVGLRLDIQSRESCWLSATADGQRVIYRLLNAGEHTQVEAKDAVDLRIGDPAAFAFTINGAAARALGAAGEAVSVHLTPQNYREYLSP
jgi:cytoskeleton protein RodZ